MSPTSRNSARLSSRDEELVALGAAIASNCVPCIEYHIPQARRTGLSDLQIGQAIALADKVRKVPADKVLQTATALLGEQREARHEGRGEGCGCPDQAKDEGCGTAAGEDQTHAQDVRLDNQGPEEDNQKEQYPCPDRMRRFFSRMSGWCSTNRNASSQEPAREN